MIKNEELGAKIKDKRISLLLTQKEVAQAVGLDISIISHIEKGIMFTDMVSTQKVCKYLGVEYEK